MKKFLNCCLVTLCYWLILFIGPAIVLLWNNFSYYVAGTGYGSESFMYKLLTFFSQPIACFVAAGLAGSLFGGKHKLCVMINCVVGACFCAVLAFFNFFFSENVVMIGSLAISAVACIITAVMFSKELTAPHLVEELERYKNENEKLQAHLKDLNDAEYVLNILSKKVEVSPTDIAEQLYVSCRKNAGLSEAAARNELQQEQSKRIIY